MSIAEETQKNIEELKKRFDNGNAKCPMCQGQSFTVVNGYFLHTVQTDLRNITIGGKGILAVILVCDKCGFISQHALSILQNALEK